MNPTSQNLSNVHTFCVDFWSHGQQGAAEISFHGVNEQGQRVITKDQYVQFDGYHHRTFRMAVPSETVMITIAVASNTFPLFPPFGKCTIEVKKPNLQTYSTTVYLHENSLYSSSKIHDI